jgi:long-chain acyl-CoA synthetase
MLALPAEVRARHDLSSMRFVSSTGSPCPPDVKRAMIEWWGPVIHECYGASELGYMTLLTSEQALRKPGSAGPPMPGVVLKILDEQGREQPTGTAGLIYIDQPATPDFSYVGRADARAEMEARGLKTMGDIGYLDEDGFLFIVDRKKDVIIAGGHNIYPLELESVLYRHPAVGMCAVVGAPDPEKGEIPVAVVVLHPNASATEEELRAWCRSELAAYKAPRRVEIIDDMPVEAAKIRKRDLVEALKGEGLDKYRRL